VPNRDAVLAWLKEKNFSCHTPEGREAALRLLESEIDAYRPGGAYDGMFPSRWLPSGIALLGEGFTEQNGLMNSTLKMVRGRITEFYKNRLDFLFTPEGQDICNHQNMTIVKRWEE
jgi:long-chain acyl-CoA synthetase